MPGFDFLGSVQNNLAQQFAPEGAQPGGSTGQNPLSQFAPQTPAAPQMAPQPSRQDLMPPPQSPTELPPQPDMSQAPPANPVADNPGGISLNELIQLGVENYMKQLFAAQQAPAPAAAPQGGALPNG